MSIEADTFDVDINEYMNSIRLTPKDLGIIGSYLRRQFCESWFTDGFSTMEERINCMATRTLPDEIASQRFIDYCDSLVNELSYDHMRNAIIDNDDPNYEYVAPSDHELITEFFEAITKFVHNYNRI